MPSPCQFCGVVFYIYYEVGAPHHKRHVSVQYGEFMVVYDIDTGEQLVGRALPSSRARLVKKVLKKYKDQLIAYWENEQLDNPRTPRPSFTPKF